MLNSLLEKIKKALDENIFELKSANEKDINSAREKGISDAVLHRLVFDDQKINSCLDSLSSVIKLECPTGKKLAVRELDEGLILEKVTYPLGVIGMVFEARPDAMVQIIDGEAEITISGVKHTVKAGEMIIMPADEPHALQAVNCPYKMILTMIKSN